MCGWDYFKNLIILSLQKSHHGQNMFQVNEKGGKVSTIFLKILFRRFLSNNVALQLVVNRIVSRIVSRKVSRIVSDGVHYELEIIAQVYNSEKLMFQNTLP